MTRAKWRARASVQAHICALDLSAAINVAGEQLLGRLRIGWQPDSALASAISRIGSARDNYISVLFRDEHAGGHDSGSGYGSLAVAVADASTVMAQGKCLLSIGAARADIRAFATTLAKRDHAAAVAIHKSIRDDRKPWQAPASKRRRKGIR